MECQFCRDPRPRVLHRHHIVPKALINLIDEKKISEELKKATVYVCENCHRILHEIAVDPMITTLREAGLTPELLRKQK